MQFTTNEYTIDFEKDNWSATVDIILYQNKLMESNPEEVKKDLEIRNFVVNEGPIEDNNDKLSYFYYKIEDKSVSKIVAYMYSSINYIFEVIYTNENGYEDLSQLDTFLNILKDAKNNINPDNEYRFDIFRLSGQ